MSEIDWDAIDSAVSESEKDDRFGDHDAMVTSITDGMYTSGDKYHEVNVNLITTRNNASISFRLPQPMTKAELDAARGKENERAVMLGQRLVSELHKFYSVNGPQDLKAGDMLRVKIGPKKSKKTGGTFPMLQAFKPKEELTGKDGKQGDPIPF